MKKTYRDLDVWRLSLELCLKIYKLTDAFPDGEKFGLTSQIRRCAISVMSNIAEGQGRSTPKDFAQFVRISIGSLQELESQLILSSELKYMTKTELRSTLSDSEAIKSKLFKLDSYLKTLNSKH